MLELEYILGILCIILGSIALVSCTTLRKERRHSAHIAEEYARQREALQEKSASLAAQKRELDEREAHLRHQHEELCQKEFTVHSSEDFSSRQLKLERERLQAANKAYREDLLQRYNRKIESIEQEYETRLQSKLSEIQTRHTTEVQSSLQGSVIRKHLPKIYDPLFTSPMSKEMVSRILSALSGDITLCSPLVCTADVKGSSGAVYQTSLASCTCEDFAYRGGPCKHMLCLLFSLVGSPYSELSGYDQIRFSSQALRELQVKFDQKVASDALIISRLKKEKQSLADELTIHKSNLDKILESNLSSVPWLAGMMADFLTYDLEMKAKYLEWGSDRKRLKKVDDIRVIRADAKARIEEAKVSVYQLEYLRQLYPGIDDVLDTDFKDLEFSISIPEHDPTRDYLSKEEWNSLSPAEKDQIALDRYVQTTNKSKWQIGRDYELSVAYEFSCKGYSIDTFGSRKGLEDLGRDVIAFKPDHTIITQCKYWSKHKTIHEKHVFQLYGTLVMYRIDHPDVLCPVSGAFVTNTVLSDTAREVAKVLDIAVVENHEMVEFPRIKCNIGRDENGITHIYHLPMDAQYDIVQIKDPGEFYAFTVQEAIDAGFRRAYKWHGK